MKIEVKMLTGTTRTVAGTVTIDGRTSSLRNVPVKLGGNQTEREQALVAAAKKEQGIGAINDK